MKFYVFFLLFCAQLAVYSQSAYAGYIFDNKRADKIESSLEAISVENSGTDQIVVTKMCRKNLDFKFSSCGKSRAYDKYTLLIMATIERIRHLEIFNQSPIIGSKDMERLKQDVEAEPTLLLTMTFGMPMLGTIVALPEVAGLAYVYVWIKEVMSPKGELLPGTAGTILKAAKVNSVSISKANGSSAIESSLHNLEELYAQVNDLLDELPNRGLDPVIGLSASALNTQFDMRQDALERLRVQTDRSDQLGDFVKNCQVDLFGYQIDLLEIQKRKSLEIL